MRKVLYIALTTMILALLSSCYESRNNNSSSYETSEAESEEEEVKEAEKKPMIFYQRLLEQFCQNYYDDCFSGREYHTHSLIADEMSFVQGNWENGNIVSWEMMIEGRHSFEGMFKNHNDSPFEAFVNDLGNDSYVVTFLIHRYDIFGDQMSEREEATRTMTYRE